MSNLLLGVRISDDFKRVHIEEVDFDAKIDNFKDDVSKKLDVPKESLELVYCGNILEDESTLRSNGLKPGVMVHVLKKKPRETPVPCQPMSEQDIKALVIAFRTLTLNPSYRHSLQKLQRPEILENIISVIPGLSQDPVAISLIQDPELIVRLANCDTVRRIVEMHPALAEAANHIAATVHEEAIANHTPGPSTSSGYSQLFDLLSDDDDMESSQYLLEEVIANYQEDASSSPGYLFSADGDFEEDELLSSQSSDSIQPGVSRQPSFSAITPAQLAAAIASASSGNGGGGGAGSGGSSSDGGGSTITPEMVSEAMQRAMASVVPARFPSQPQDSSEDGSNLREGLRQMRELGLTDDAVNLQALQLAGGNVHAAVDLVFSGAISPTGPA